MRKSVLATSVAAMVLALAGCDGATQAPQNAAAANMSTAAGGDAPQTFSKVVDNDVLTRMFQWWNDAYTKPDGFTAAAFGQYFTDDAVMKINGRESARGLDDFASHFREIQKRTQKVKINLPFVEAFSSPDGTKIFTYHTIDAAADGKPSHELVAGYAEIRDGKIALINFLSLDQAPPASGK